MGYETKRVAKRLVIALIYLLLLGVVGLLIYALRVPAAPSCFDHIQNQNETGVDCGGSCKSCEAVKGLTVYEAKVFSTKEGFADVFAEVRNTNIDYGIHEFQYTFELYDRDDALITSKNGITYILPNSRKFIIEQAIATTRLPVKVKFLLRKTQFEEVKHYIKPRLNIINPSSKIVSSDQGGVLAVQGTVANQSSYNLDKVVIAIRLKDELGQTVAVNKHEVRTLEPSAYRFFQVQWLYRAPHFTDIDTEVDTNVFEESNYLKFLKSVPNPQPSQ